MLTALLTAALALPTATGAPEPPPDPPTDITPLLRYERNVIARLYPPDARDDKDGVLGLVARGREVHIGHGSTDSRAPTRPLVLDVATGRAVTILPDGRRVPLPPSYSPALEPFEMRTEGTIPFLTADGAAYLDWDPLTDRTEVYVVPPGGTPTTRRSGPPGHNFAAGRVLTGTTDGILAVHNSGRSLWPSISVSTDGGDTWTNATNAGAYPGFVGYCRFALYRGRLYAFDPVVVGDDPGTRPAVFTVERGGPGEIVARTLWLLDEDFWPAGSSWEILYGGQTLVQWPQVREGLETAEGLYLHTTGGLFFTPDPERHRPIRVPVAGERAVYAVGDQQLFAIVGGRLRRFKDGAWATEARIAPPFEVEWATSTDRGDLVVVGGQDEDVVLAYIPARELLAAVPSLRRGGSQLLAEPAPSETASAVASAEAEPAPEALTLSASPNPARERSALAFTLPEAAHVRLVVYDVLGREVARLADGECSPGRHEVTFDGAELPAGVYLATLKVGDYELVQPLTLLR